MDRPRHSDTFSRDLRALERRRVREAARDRGRTLGPGFARLATALRRKMRELGGVGDAWFAACPPELARRTKVIGLTGGSLTIGVVNDADRFAIDRWLRSGGLLAVARAAPSAVRRVKFVRVNASDVATPIEPSADATDDASPVASRSSAAGQGATR